MGITVLGPLSIAGSPAVLGRRDRVVLAALAMRPGQTVRTDNLVEALWGDAPPASSAKVLQGCVMRLRKLLGPDSIETAAQGYRLTHDPEEVDASRFERLVGRARELLRLGEPERAAYLLDEALGLWHGRPFPDLESWPPGGDEAARLDEVRLHAEELRVEALLRAGHHEEVVAEASAMVRAAPMRERRWWLLALAQYQSGRQDEAFRTIREVKALLVGRLGVDPGPELVELERAMLRQDDSLLVGEPIRGEDRCPYRGLEPYEADDAEVFFGRRAETERCVDLAVRTAVLAIVGPSGCGKSSLARAGVVVGLRRAGHQVTVIAPGPHPMRSLDAVPRRTGTFLVVDQSEEVFTLCDDPAERQDFLAALADWPASGALVVTMPADRLAAAAEHPPFARLLERGLFLIGTLDEDGLREVIEGPASQYGLLMEPGLVDLLLRDVEIEPAALPLLSHALQETWKRREGSTMTVAGYLATGGIRGAVAQSAEDVYAAIEPAKRHLLREVMLRLVTAGPEGEAVRSRVPRRLVATDPDHDALVDRLVTARLLSTDQGVVEVSHEALARAWPRLSSWLDEDVEGQRILRHLTAAADGWDALGRPASELYRGSRLAKALDWSEANRSILTDVETDFLGSSAEVEQHTLRAAEERAREQGRMIRRLRQALSGAAVLLTCALLAGLVALVQAHRADRAAGEADLAATAADARQAGARALVTTDVDEAMLLAVAAVRLDDTPQTRSSLFGVLSEHPELVRSIQTAGRIGDLDISPAASSFVTLDETHLVRSYDLASGRLLAEHQAGSSTPEAYDGTRVKYHPDGNVLAVLMPMLSKRPVTLLAADTLRPTPLQVGGLPQARRKAGAVAWSADGGTLAVLIRRMRGSAETLHPAEASVAVWSLDRPHRPVVVPLTSAGISPQVALSPDGRTLYATQPFTIYDLEARERLPERAPDVLEVQGTPLGIDASPDGKLLAVATGDDGNVLLLDAADGSPVRVLKGVGDRFLEARFSADGSLVAAVAFIDSTAVVWDVASGRRRHVIPLPEFGIAVDFGVGNDALFTAGADSAVRRWDLGGADRFLEELPTKHEPPFPGFVVPSPAGDFVAYNNHYQHGFLEVETGHLAVVDRPESFRIGPGSWRPGTPYFASAHDGVIRVYDARTGETVDEVRPAGRYVSWVDYSDDGSRLMYSEMTGRVGMLDAATLEPLGDVELDHAAVEVSAGADNRTAVVVTGGDDVSGQYAQPRNGWALVDLGDGSVLTEGSFELSADWVDYSPDGRHVAVGFGDEGLGVLDLERDALVRPPVPSDPGLLMRVTYSDDGSRIVGAGAGNTVGLWDGATGELQSRLTLGDPFHAAGFLPDGSVLVAAFGRSLTRWDTSIGRAVDLACRVAGRDLTAEEWRDVFGERPYQETCPQG